MQVFYEPKAEKFIAALNDDSFSRVMKIIDLLERHGNALGLPHSRHLGGGLLELRVLGVPPFRLLYIFQNGNVRVVHAIMKKTQRIPKKEIEFARKIAKLLD